MKLQTTDLNAKTQRGKAATELREAFGVRGACSRFRTAQRLPTAPASWTHSKRFAWQFIRKNLRSSRAYRSKAVQGCQDAWISAAWHLHRLGESFSLLIFLPFAPLPLGDFALTAVFPPPTRQPDAFAISTGGS